MIKFRKTFAFFNSIIFREDLNNSLGNEKKTPWLRQRNPTFSSFSGQLKRSTCQNTGAVSCLETQPSFSSGNCSVQKYISCPWSYIIAKFGLNNITWDWITNFKILRSNIIFQFEDYQQGLFRLKFDNP